MTTNGVPGDLLRHINDMGMMRKDHHLRLFAQFRETFERRRLAVLVEIHEHVIDDHRHRAVRLEMLLDARQPQREKELISRAVGKAGDFDALVRLSTHGPQNRFAFIVFIDIESRELPARENLKVAFRAGEQRAFAVLAEAVDREPQRLPGEMDGGVFRRLLAKLSQQRFDGLLAVGRLRTGRSPEVDLLRRGVRADRVLRNLVVDRLEPFANVGETRVERLARRFRGDDKRVDFPIPCMMAELTLGLRQPIFQIAALIRMRIRAGNSATFANPACSHKVCNRAWHWTTDCSAATSLERDVASSFSDFVRSPSRRFASLTRLISRSTAICNCNSSGAEAFAPSSR